MERILNEHFDRFLMKCRRCLPLSVLLLLTSCYLVLYYLVFKVFATNHLKESKKSTKTNLILDKRMMQIVAGNDWPDYDFRFKKQNIIIVYGWNKYCLTENNLNKF